MSVGQTQLRRDWKLRLDTDMVLRVMGADPNAMRTRHPQLVKRIDKIILEHRDWLRPVAVICDIAVRGNEPGVLTLENHVELRSRTLYRRLAGTDYVIAVVATIGSELESHLGISDSVDSLIVDGAGSAAISALTCSILDDILTVARARGCNATNPLHPGMKGWTLAEGQAQIFAMVEGRAAGVSFNEAFMMTPRKSTSFLIGVGPRIALGPHACEECGAAEDCQLKTQLYAC